jgi:hypothetical protein
MLEVAAKQVQEIQVRKDVKQQESANGKNGEGATEKSASEAAKLFRTVRAA